LAWVIFGFSRLEIDSLGQNEGTSYNPNLEPSPAKAKVLENQISSLNAIKPSWDLET
jgi:hypothetical protein